ncbi:MAG: hypothetical protein N2749_04940 [Clostridia bacterium]|nr:hypothetical protein [Clostridia bacterium]
MKEKKDFKKKIVIVILVATFILLIGISIFLYINKKKDNSIPKDQNFVTDSKGIKTNTSVEISKEKKVSSIIIEQTKVTYENNMTRLTSKVTNNGQKQENLRFLITFIDNSSNKIGSTVGYIGTLENNEIKYIDSYVELDLVNAKDVIYEIIP